MTARKSSSSSVKTYLVTDNYATVYGSSDNVELILKAKSPEEAVELAEEANGEGINSGNIYRVYEVVGKPVTLNGVVRLERE